MDSIRSELGIRETVQLGWRKLFCCTDRFEVSEIVRLYGLLQYKFLYSTDSVFIAVIHIPSILHRLMLGHI